MTTHSTTERTTRTPGPWVTRTSAARGGDERLDVGIVAALAEHGGANVVIAEAFGRVEQAIYIDAAANARLIAAAPDLLAALKDILAASEVPACLERERAVAAIAKAEGVQ